MHILADCWYCLPSSKAFCWLGFCKPAAQEPAWGKALNCTPEPVMALVMFWHCG